MTRLLQVLAIAVVATAVCGIVAVYSGYTDREQAAGNAFGAWTSGLWSQTSAGDFQSGTAWQADATTVAGVVRLAVNASSAYMASARMSAAAMPVAAMVSPTPTPVATASPTPTPVATISPTPVAVPPPVVVYFPAGSLTSTIHDTGIGSATWDALCWNATLPGATNITFYIRASDSAAALESDAVAWVAVGNASPVTAGLPAGRYLQWRVNLTTSDTSVTPTLSEVRAWYH